MNRLIKRQDGIVKTNWIKLWWHSLFILIGAELCAHLCSYFFRMRFSLSEIEETLIEPLLTTTFAFLPIWHFLIKPLQNKFQQVTNELYSYEVALQQHAIVSKTDPQGKIIYANKKFLEISGYSAEELYGRDHRIVNSGHHSPEFFATMWKTIKSHNGWRGQVCNKSKNGHLYWMDTTITQVTDPENGKIQEYLSIRFDITAEKEQGQKQLHTSKLVSLGEMAASMAHEINNPLAIISGIIQRFERGTNDHQIPAPSLQKIKKSIDRIAKIVNGLKKFSRVTPIDNKSIHSLSGIVSEAVSLTEIKANYMNTSIDLTIEAELFILCNDIEIEQVIINIVNNAIDIIENVEKKWIKIKILEDNSQAVLRIMDSGTGIPESIHDKIFEPFFTTKEIGQETGLGLSISKGIIEDHNGTISLLKDEMNTCFEIRFPIASSVKKQLAS